METRDHRTRNRRKGLFVRKLCAFGAGVVIVISTCVLLGWALDLQWLMSILPGFIRMKANAALAFLAAAAALLLEFGGARAIIRRVVAAVPLTIGAATFFQYATGFSLNIDELFFNDPMQVAYPGRMAHITAISFIFLGLALLLREGSRTTSRLSAGLALIVTTGSVLAMVGYLYGVPILYGPIQYTAMAVHTGICLLLLSVGVVFVDPSAPIARLVWSESTGGLVARRLLPAMVITPIALGRIFMIPELNFNEMRMGMAFVAISSIMLFGAVVANICHTLDVTWRAKVAAELSMHVDGLTGVFNRRYFDRRMTDEFERSQRYGTPMSVVLFDGDHFKAVNDRHGHAAGDDVLRTIAMLSAWTLRPSDVVCRYGGEEFVLVLPQTSGEDAEVIAERVRIAIEYGVQRAVGIPVTVSLGVASVIAGDAQATDLIARADQALYEAKASGRNCVRRKQGRLQSVPRTAARHGVLAESA